MKSLFLAALLLVLGLPAWADEEAYAEDGKDIYVVCATCHGPEGQGGAGGDYPRLAGLPFEYLKEQLQAFKARDRINIPMFPYTVERELNDQDILDVSAFITEMELSSRLPEASEDMDGYTRLLAAKRVLQIPRYDGDAPAGQALYAEQCSRCHGANGEGREPHDPPLAGQYSKYLKKQLADMVDESRYHPRLKRLIAPLSAADVDNLLAHLSTLDD